MLDTKSAFDVVSHDHIQNLCGSCSTSELTINYGHLLMTCIWMQSLLWNGKAKFQHPLVSNSESASVAFLVPTHTKYLSTMPSSELDSLESAQRLGIFAWLHLLCVTNLPSWQSQEMFFSFYWIWPKITVKITDTVIRLEKVLCSQFTTQVELNLSKTLVNGQFDLKNYLS